MKLLIRCVDCVYINLTVGEFAKHEFIIQKLSLIGNNLPDTLSLSLWE